VVERAQNRRSLQSLLTRHHRGHEMGWVAPRRGLKSCRSHVRDVIANRLAQIIENGTDAEALRRGVHKLGSPG
jgi:hypothetical protein